MAGKISELTAATSVADADEVEVLQGGVNKRGAFSVLWTYISSKIGTLGTLAGLNSVGATEITDGAVGSVELSDNAVVTAKVADSAVTAAKISPTVWSGFAASVTPDANNTRNFGTNASRWAAGHFNSLFVNGTELSGTEMAAPTVDSGLFYDMTTSQVEYWTPGKMMAFAGTVLELSEAQRTKEVVLECFRSTETVTIGDGKAAFVVPDSMSGMDIVGVRAVCATQGVTGATDIQIRRVRTGTAADVLSTKVTLGAEYHVADGAINTANDDLATGDIVFADVDAIHTTAPQGLWVIVLVRLP